MGDLRQNENAGRVGRLRKDSTLEDRVLTINRALAPLEQPGDPATSPPTVFVVGLPRSGTTLCQQLLAYCLDVGYINNLIARFWLAPTQGVAISRAVLGDARGTLYTSDYATTSEPAGVHEFSYFWHDLLGIRAEEDVLQFGRPNQVDWTRAAQRVAALASTFVTSIAGVITFLILTIVSVVYARFYFRQENA